MVGGAVVGPLQDLGAGGRALVLHGKHQAAVVVLDFVLAAPFRDELPEVVRRAVVSPDERVGAGRDALVGDAEQLPAGRVLDFVVVGAFRDQGPVLGAAAARGRLDAERPLGGTAEIGRAYVLTPVTTQSVCRLLLEW